MDDENVCINCDRFVDEVDEDGYCIECRNRLTPTPMM
jgi:hypothetical protein